MPDRLGRTSGVTLAIEPGRAGGLRQTIASIQRQSRPPAGLVELTSTHPEERNRALERARGTHLGFITAGDRLHPGALAAVEAALAESPADLLYTDEGPEPLEGPRAERRLKPGWSPWLLRSTFYPGRLTLYRIAALRAAGGFDPELGESAEYGAALLLGEAGRVRHLARPLYRRDPRPADPGGTPPGEPLHTSRAAGDLAALRAHAARLGIDAEISLTPVAGVYRFRPRPAGEPLVSVIIPTRGARRRIRGEDRDLLAACIAGLGRITYRRLEILAVHDSDTPAASLAAAAADPRVRLIPFSGPFNFSEKVNLGAAHAGGDHLLLLNDDVEPLSSDFVETMLGILALPGTGAVGARLLYGDGRLQHAGVVLNHGLCLHACHGFPGEHPGPGGILAADREVSAVTGACLMTRADAFAAAGGLSPRYPGSFNDVDYCLKLWRLGWSVVYTPHAVLHHHESSSRSTQPTPEEAATLAARWSSRLYADPYYNPGYLASRATFM